MTKSGFKCAMQRGLGSCMLTLESAGDIEQYRDIILWGCLRKLALDPQCEGTRARYIYELASYYDDEAYFVEPIAGALKKMHSTGGWQFWLFIHHCEILLCFAQGGNAAARTALYEKYDVLYHKLRRAHRGSRACSLVLDDFETLCIVLTALDGVDRYVSIASDIGALFGKPGFTGIDFLWFIDEGKSMLGAKLLCKHLLKAAKDSENLACFCGQMTEPAKTNTVQEPAPVPTAAELFVAASKGELPIAKRVQFRRAASNEEKKKLAEHILACNNPSVKAVLLSTFFGVGFPGPCEAIIADVRSGNQQLREAALMVLEKCRGEEVRTLAFELLPQKEYTANAICMLITNYCKSDKEKLLRALYRLPVTYSGSNGWHGVVHHILWAFEQGDGREYPRELLHYIYQNSLCSGCRENAVKHLVRKKWLTSEIMSECRYDSNENIREFIESIQK
ncbi:hypothetical protein DW091_19245 [Eubacterium sp. AM05-23]|uniref:hypothetical protein n=1 Tax=Eubacterium TaxID=1730 RepID=UPI000E4AB3E3|nr:MULTISPECIES: hypothetical protein [Eubacterium]RHO53576.1 hypothetical protein DW091_19245 [Eubacterium sp. AM05-23]